MEKVNSITMKINCTFVVLTSFNNAFQLLVSYCVEWEDDCDESDVMVHMLFSDAKSTVLVI